MTVSLSSQTDASETTSRATTTVVAMQAPRSACACASLGVTQMMSAYTTTGQRQQEVGEGGVTCVKTKSRRHQREPELTGPHA